MFWVWDGRAGNSVSKLVNPRKSYLSRRALLPPVESNVARWRQVSRGIEYMAIVKTGGSFKSNTGHFYINFEYKTHLNFGGNTLETVIHECTLDFSNIQSDRTPSVNHCSLVGNTFSRK